MANEVVVYKLDERGEEVWRYSGTVLERRDHCIQLEATFDRDAVDLGPVIFEHGDRFIETYYSDRWYNVFAVYRHSNGAFKGWYCNICRPATIEDHAVRSADLALDVWVNPAGSTTLIDKEEFAALDLSPDERRQSRQALETLLQLAEAGRLPG
ncbi:MAG TPA: DUF402 domain-containing protein [Candidatus Sulfomarinibacteraceae bacterium]|nr:DUF402 domain-containing protein [Candidatus Sulfomarinibacteraceae bacterium]